MRRAAPLRATVIACLVALVLLAGVALAARTAVYTPRSSLSLSGVTPPVVKVEAGTDSGPNDYVTGFAINPAGTAFTATVSGLGGARLVVTEIFKVRNADTAPHGVRLTGTQIGNAQVTACRIEVFSGATNLGTLDLKSASPSVDLGTLAAGGVLTAKLTVTLADGAGANTVNTNLAIATVMTA